MTGPEGQLRRGLLIFPNNTGYDLTVLPAMACELRSYREFRTVLGLKLGGGEEE